jgi:hypothetical protein
MNEEIKFEKKGMTGKIYKNNDKYSNFKIEWNGQHGEAMLLDSEAQKNMIRVFDIYYDDKPVSYLKVTSDVIARMMSLQEKAEREHERVENLHLIQVVEDSNLGSGYALSTRIEKDKWNKISAFMRYYDESTQDATNFFDNDYRGWVTFKPALVEDALDIKKELRVAQRDDAAREKREKIEKEKEREEQYIEEKYKGVKHIDRSWDDYRFECRDVLEELKHYVVHKYHAEEGTMKDEYFEKKEVKEFLKKYPEKGLIGVVVKRKRG